MAAWLRRHPRFVLRFTPTGASWPNQAERYFARTAGRRLRRSAFHTVAEFEAAIADHLAHHHQDPTCLGDLERAVDQAESGADAWPRIILK